MMAASFLEEGAGPFSADAGFGLETRTRRLGPPRSMSPVPVWPSGDWLPFLRIERATQVHGWFGLAVRPFPPNGCLNITSAEWRNWRSRPIRRPHPAAVSGVAAPRADRGQVSPDLVGASCLEAYAQQCGAREALQHAEVRHGPLGPVGAGGHDGAAAAVAAERRVDRAADRRRGGRPRARGVLPAHLPRANRLLERAVRLLERATISRPVSRSSRCTMPGRSGSGRPPPRAPPWPRRASGPCGRGRVGNHPAGLSTTIRCSSSKTTSNGTGRLRRPLLLQDHSHDLARREPP